MKRIGKSREWRSEESGEVKKEGNDESREVKSKQSREVNGIGNCRVKRIEK